MVSRARSLLDRYRRHGARALLDHARSAAAQLLTPEQPPRPAPVVRPAPEPAALESAPRSEDDVLAALCAGIAVRDLNLVDSLLAMLEQMEADEDDPDTLTRLYRLDHLATRLRRNAENLRVLAGQEAGTASEETTSLIDVIRAAMSSIEQYTRIEIGRVAGLAVAGFAADDVSRLVAELLDNAAAQSPPTTSVSVSAHVTEQGSVLLRIEDAGIGLPQERLATLNERLSAVPRLDNESIEHMGLAVVRALANKHEIKVWLGRRSPHGTTASVLLRPELVREAAPAVWTRPPGEDAPAPRARRPITPPAPREEEQAVASATTASGLPRRLKAPRRTTPAPPRPDGEGADVAETTPGGLPRRISRSLRSEAPAEETEAEARAGRARLVSDLGAFVDGEEAARKSLEAQDKQTRDGETA